MEFDVVKIMKYSKWRLRHIDHLIIVILLVIIFVDIDYSILQLFHVVWFMDGRELCWSSFLEHSLHEWLNVVKNNEILKWPLCQMDHLIIVIVLFIIFVDVDFSMLQLFHTLWFMDGRNLRWSSFLVRTLSMRWQTCDSSQAP